MRARCWIAGALGIAAVGVLGGQAAKADKAPKPPPPNQPAKVEKAPAQDPAMDAFMKAMTPGEAHKRLNPLVGTWDVTATFWTTGPESAPEVSGGTAVSKWVLNGRWIHMDYTSTWMDQPFQGIGYTGYDNVEQKYVNTWMDNMGTGLSYATGSADAAGKVFTYTSAQHTCPMTGKPVSNRFVHTIVSNDQHTFIMYHTYAGEKEQKAAELVYTRRK